MSEALLLKNSPPSKICATVILAHGAGAPMDSVFMETIALELCNRGCEVYRFEFPYMQQRRDRGIKRPPDQQHVLMNSWRSNLERICATLPKQRPLIIGGKSLGGRIASMIADESPIDGLVCLGYPFHPANKPDRLRTEHLLTLKTPALFLQGTRDLLGNQEEVASYPLASSITLKWLPDGDHDLKPRKQSGYTHTQHIVSTANHVLEFIQQL